MTVEEFEDYQATLKCRECGAANLYLEVNPNNGGVRPVCADCGSKRPVAGVQWLRQRSARSRMCKRSKGISPEQVWEANGDHCGFCGKPKALCIKLGIGLTAQHVVPVVFGGEDGPLVPFCSRCQQASAAALEETRRVVGVFGQLETVIQRIERRFPELNS